MTSSRLTIPSIYICCSVSHLKPSTRSELHFLADSSGNEKNECGSPEYASSFTGTL